MKIFAELLLSFSAVEDAEIEGLCGETPGGESGKSVGTGGKLF